MSEISNDTIVERIEGVRTLIEEKFEYNYKDHQRIEAQTTKTNGRVNRLEEEMSSLSAWKNKVLGALIITEMILLPLAIWALTKILDNKI